MPDAGPRYWAFLSYSHADIRWGRRLHRALEAYRLPRRLVGRPTPAGPAPPRLRPIFRDLDEMGAASSLSDRLKSALDVSASLIVVCSPASAASPWVNEEIRRFKAARGEDNILAVIVAGEPFASERPGREAEECFPPALRQRHADGERIEPAAADLRPGHDPLRTAVLKLVAGVLDIELDELVRRDAARRNRQLLALTAVFGLTAAAMTSLAVLALQQRDEARRERAQAEGMVEFMITDLKDKLQPAGRLDILDAIGGKAQAYYAAERNRGLDAAGLGQRARVLHLLGDIQQQRGDLPGARKLFEEAASSTGEILKRRPGDPTAIYNHAQSVAYIGEVAYDSRDFAAALPQLQRYQALARRLAAIDPKNLDWLAEVEEADTNVGVVELSLGRPDAAAREFSDALAISRRLAAAPSAKRAWLWDEAQSLAWRADAEVAQGRLADALSDRLAEGGVYQAMIAASAHDDEAAAALADARAAIARIDLARGDAKAASAVLEDAAGEVDDLIRRAPDNAVYQAEAFTVMRERAQAFLQQGRLTEAAASAARAVDLAQAQVRAADARHDAALGWRGGRLGVAELLSIRIAATAAPTRQAQQRALLPALATASRLRTLLATHPQDHLLALAAAEAALLAGDFQHLAGQPGRARSDWGWAQATLATSTLAGDDRRPALLRQAAYRLTSRRPPPSPSPAGVATGSVSGARIDYRW